MSEAESLDKVLPELSKSLATLGKQIREYNAAKTDSVGNYFRLLKLLDSSEILYKRISVQCKLPKAEAWLANEKSLLQSSRWEFEARFGKSLATQLSELQFTLEGAYPEFKVGFLTIEVADKQETTTLWYGNKEEKLRIIHSVNAEALSKEIKAEHQRITRQRFASTDQLLSNLWQAYRTTLSHMQLSMGSPVELIRVLQELNVIRQGDRFWQDPRGKEFRAYTREEFSYDLSRLLESNKTVDGRTLQLNVATREQNRDRAKYLWIPFGGTRGSIYSTISFRGRDSVTS